MKCSPFTSASACYIFKTTVETAHHLNSFWCKFELVLEVHEMVNLVKKRKKPTVNCDGSQ